MKLRLPDLPDDVEQITTQMIDAMYAECGLMCITCQRYEKCCAWWDYNMTVCNPERFELGKKVASWKKALDKEESSENQS